MEVVNGKPWRMAHWTNSILDIDADGMLEVERLSTQQFARVDDRFEPASPGQFQGGRVFDAAKRFVAKGGFRETDERLLRRIEAATLGLVSYPRVLVVR